LNSSRGAWIPVVAVCLVVASAGVARADGAGAPKSSEKPSERSSEKSSFAPFDAGDKRDVVRQGTKGKARRAHPMVGEAAKVPGEGPPPPPLHLDLDLPEGAVDKKNVNALGGDLSANPLFLASLTYANIITKIDGPRCTHLPTCSRFASQAVARHGVIGIFMGLDRVMQPNESSPLRRLPEVEGFGGVRSYDPVENYEFWHTERFTGFPPPTKEEPLALPPLKKAPLK
jgi:hypothetical protein